MMDMAQLVLITGLSQPSRFNPLCPTSTGWQLKTGLDPIALYSANESEVPNLMSLTGLENELNTQTWICQSSTVKGVMVGPFVSLPGRWLTLELDLLRSKIISEGDMVMSFVGDAMMADGKTLTYPPLHVHHLHVTGGPTSHWFETHGDYDGHVERGYNTTLPDGYCMKTPDMVHLQVGLTHAQAD